MIKLGRNLKDLAIFVAVATFIIKFMKRAYNAGRVFELFISTFLLAGSYYLLYMLVDVIPWWTFLFPLPFYFLYWCYLFSFEKITCSDSCRHWADRDWWWNLDGWQFEEEAAKVLRLNGYKAKVTKKTGDGGIDILMYKDKKKIIVQCKHYTSPVGVSVTRELNGIREDFNADELVLIASSGVTKDAMNFVKNKPYFRIWDLEDIIRMGLRPYSS